ISSTSCELERRKASGSLGRASRYEAARVNTPSTLAIPRGELRSSELDPFQLTFTRKITRRHCCADSRSRANTNDCLPCAPPGRTEGGDGIVECGDGADVRPQSFVAHALDDLVQLGTIAFDDEVVPAARLHAHALDKSRLP